MTVVSSTYLTLYLLELYGSHTMPGTPHTFKAVWDGAYYPWRYEVEPQTPQWYSLHSTLLRIRQALLDYHYTLNPTDQNILVR